MKVHLRHLIILGLAVMASACNDDNEKISPQVSEEVSLLVATSVASNTYGVHALIGQSTVFYNDAINTTGGRQSVCDYTESGEASVESAPNDPISYSYSYSYDIAVNCSSIQVPTSLSVGFSYAGSFDGPKLVWEHEGTGDFDITLSPVQHLIYNGTFERSGQYDLKERENINGSSSVELTLTNITVDPETESIVSGQGEYTITVSRNDTVYTISGSLIFNGDGTATLEINGSEVTFDLITSVTR